MVQLPLLLAVLILAVAVVDTVVGVVIIGAVAVLVAVAVFLVFSRTVCHGALACSQSPRRNLPVPRPDSRSPSLTCASPSLHL